MSARADEGGLDVAMRIDLVYTGNCLVKRRGEWRRPKIFKGSKILTVDRL